jgi:small GTP-binding protein
MRARKVCMIGDFAVGKTSLVSRFVHSTFGEGYLTTVGVKVDTKVLRLPSGDDLKLVLWDIAGKSALAEIDMSYLRGASGYLLVIDGTRPETFEGALRLQADVERALGPTPFTVLLNKTDLVDRWHLTDDQTTGLISRGWRLHHTSALTGEGVEGAFRALGAQLVHQG